MLSIQLNRYALDRQNEIKILDGSKLNDNHVDLFHNILSIYSPYNPQSTLIMQHVVKNPESTRINPISRNVRHLQLLHSCEDLCNKCLGGHWICCFYDTTALYIYDSLNSRRLHVNNELFLKKLFPFFNEIPKHYIKVQHQNNNRDCAVFAIAFATSIFFKQNPSQIIYDIDKMRPHLYDMLQRNTLVHFPTVKNESLNRHLLSTGTPLTVVNKNKVSILKTSVADKNKRLDANTIVIDGNSFDTSIISNSKKLPVQTDSSEKISSSWNVIGLPNPDIQCYANASLQTLLHCISIRQKFYENPESNAFYNALQAYTSKAYVNVMALREFADKKYIIKEQQDVAEFITHLCNKSNNLHTVLKHELTIQRKCITCNDIRIYEPTDNYILDLALPNSNIPKLQDIINFNIDKWNRNDIPCNNECPGFIDDKMLLHTSNNTLILQLKLFVVNNYGIVRKINNIKIRNLDKEIVVINKNHYKVMTALFHHGDNIKLGHYTSMLRVNDHWLKVDDLQVYRTSWPENSKNVYLIFLEKICKEALPQQTMPNDCVQMSKSIHSNKEYQRLIQSNNNHLQMNIKNRSNVNNNSIIYTGSKQQNKGLLSSSKLKINDCTKQSPLNLVDNDVLNNVEIFTEKTLTATAVTPNTVLSISNNKTRKRKKK